MKWYFALNESSLRMQPDYWESLITVAIRSARKHTNLSPHLLYDGGDHPVLDRFRAMGVTVVNHRVSFYDALEQYGETAHIASGAFLRTEIPLIEQDDVVLYTDCDVMFVGDIDLAASRPAFFSCAPEFTKDDRKNFNTGVMVMNLKALREDASSFFHFIRHNLDKCITYDQDAYRIYYEGRVDDLPITYNWKPYWGASDEARIVHFHGPKPQIAIQMLAGSDIDFGMLRPIFDWNVDGYRRYVSEWEAIAAAS